MKTQKKLTRLIKISAQAFCLLTMASVSWAEGLRQVLSTDVSLAEAELFSLLEEEAKIITDNMGKPNFNPQSFQHGFQRARDEVKAGSLSWAQAISGDPIVLPPNQ